MKSIISLSVLSLFTFCNLSAQDATLTVKEGQSCMAIDNIGSRGVLIQTGAETFTTTVKNFSMHYFSTDLKTKWTVDVGNQSKDWQRCMITSNNDYVYRVVREKKDLLSLIQVNNNGAMKQASVDFGFDYNNISGKDYTTCDDENLYICRYNGDYKNKAIYACMVINHKTLRQRKVELKFPLEGNKDLLKTMGYWRIAGVIDGKAYLLLHGTEKKEGKISYRFLGFDLKNGSIVDDSYVSFHSPGKFPNEVKLENKYYFQLFLGNTLTFESFTEGNSEYSRKRTYSAMYFDEIDKSIYLYSLYTKNPSQTVALHKQTDGFFVYKYDLSGKLIYGIDQEFPPSIKSKDNHKSGFIPDVGIYIDRKNNGLLFSMSLVDIRYQYYLDAKGEYVGKSEHQLLENNHMIYPGMPSANTNAYIAKSVPRVSKRIDTESIPHGTTYHSKGLDSFYKKLGEGITENNKVQYSIVRGEMNDLIVEFYYGDSKKLNLYSVTSD